MAQPKKVEFVIGARDATRRAFRRIRAGLRRLSGAVLNFRVLVGGVFAGAAIRGLSKFAEGLERVADNARSLGLTTDQLQGLQFAAKEVGVSGNDVITVFQRLGRRIGEAQDNTGGMIEAFAALGITLDDLVGKSEVQIFDQILAAAKELPPTLAKARIGKILDIEGLKLVRLLIEEFGSVAEAVAAARAAGAIRTEKQLEAAEEFAKSLREFGNQFAADIAPALLSFSGIIRENTPALIAAMHDLANGIKNFIGGVRGIANTATRAEQSGRAAVEAFTSRSPAEVAQDTLQAIKEGRFTSPGKLLTAGIEAGIDAAVRNIQEIRDISSRAEKRAQRGAATAIWGP